MSSHRWMKFWPADWQRDPALRMCSLAARGLWIELLSIAHEAQPYGHVLVSGRAPTPRQIAQIVGATERDVIKLLSELEEAGVFSRTAAGVIYSRRMVRDHERSEEGRASVAKRWTNKAPEPEPTRELNTPPIRVGGRSPDSLEAEADTETEKNPPTPRKRGSGAMVGFPQFWTIYPRKVGKGAAEKAWPRAVQAAGGDWQAIVMGLQVQIDLGRFDMRDDGRFCPHASTWLNGKRWLDGHEPGLLEDAA